MRNFFACLAAFIGGALNFKAIFQAPLSILMGVNTVAAAGLTPQQWDDKFFTEYIRANRFSKYMGKSENNIIQLKDDLTAKPGKTVTFALVNAITGSGKRGSATLVGNEQKMNSRSCKVTVDKVREAVVVPEIDEQYSAISLRDASKVVLKNWALALTKTDIINGLGQVSGDYQSGIKTIWDNMAANSVVQDAWALNNVDRVLFGASKANYAADFSAALLNVDVAGDLISVARLDLMKVLAKTASPIIPPTMVNGDEEWYVVFMGTRNFTTYKNDPVIVAANRDARIRGVDNPLFTGGDLLYNGMIIREIPEITVLTGAGATAVDVEPVFLVGAQALGIAWAQHSKTITDDTDYGDKQGVAVQEIRGIQKLIFGTDANVDTTAPKDNGVFTGFFAAPPLTAA